MRGSNVKILSRDLLVPAYTIGVIGAFLQVAGGYWDITWHVLGIVETFFTPPHAILYTGVALVLLAAILGLLMRVRVFSNDDPQRHLLSGLLIAAVGGGLQVAAGPLDFWWHSTFGFDPFLFTPSHSLLIIGIILGGFGMAIGSVRLLQAYRSNMPLGRFLASSKWLQVLVLLALTTLWQDLGAFIHLVTDVRGMAYTFNLSKDFVNQTLPTIYLATPIIALGAAGTLVLFSVKSILRWTGAVTTVALLSAFLSATVNLGFRAFVLAGKEEGSALASFIPLYISLVVPVLLFDLVVKNSQGRARTVLAAAVIAPFASLLSGGRPLYLLIQIRPLIPILIVPIVVAGAIAGLSGIRFADALLRQQPVTATQTR